MNPILADRRRLSLYLLTWALLALLLSFIVMEPGRVAPGAALLLTIPPTLVYAFVCLAGWYSARVMPLDRTPAAVLVLTHTIAALILSSVWLFLFRGWTTVLRAGHLIPEDIRVERARVLFLSGVFLYLLSVAFHYLLLALEVSRNTERRAMDVKVLSREAELKALKAQVDPHFLFNSLNSIASLCGSNPTSARTLTTLLAEFLRKSLRAGSSETITLSEELELASSYLAIERIRFGPRLEFEQNVEERARTLRLPPLLLQPLVENAVTHGIGQLIEGGVVRLSARRDGDHVTISVENRCDPDRIRQTGTGIGLANTKRRVEAFYGSAGRVHVIEQPGQFCVELVLPA